MSAVNEESPLTMMLTQEAHFVAQQFYRKYSEPQKSKQVYLNTLAVKAVSQYLKYFGIHADLDGSESWDPVSQALLNTGALNIPDFGTIECRPVLPNAASLQVPPEVWSDRLGYVAVQFDSDLETATLLGFTQTVEAEEISLDLLQPLETLLDVLNARPDLVAHLSQWLQHTVESGWSTLEDFFNGPQVAFSFRGGPSLAPLTIGEGSIARCCSLRLGSEEPDQGFALVVAVNPAEAADFDIWVRVVPTGEQRYLPSNLGLMLVDEGGDAIMQAQSRETESIGLKFRGDLGDRFGIQIKLGPTTILERFVI